MVQFPKLQKITILACFINKISQIKKKKKQQNENQAQKQNPNEILINE